MERIAALSEAMTARLAELKRIGKIEDGVMPATAAYGGIPALRRRIVDPDGVPRADLQLDDDEAIEAVNDWRRTFIKDLADMIRAGPQCDLAAEVDDDTVLDSPEAIFACSGCKLGGMCRTSALLSHACLVKVPLEQGVDFSDAISLPSRYLSRLPYARTTAFAVIDAVGLDVDRTTLTDLADMRFLIRSSGRTLLEEDDDEDQISQIKGLFADASFFGRFVRAIALQFD